MTHQRSVGLFVVRLSSLHDAATLTDCPLHLGGDSMHGSPSARNPGGPDGCPFPGEVRNAIGVEK